MTKIQSKNITLSTQDGSFDAYLAHPDSGTREDGTQVQHGVQSEVKRGSVVVIQEIFGINNNIKSVVNWLAGEGYVAIAPDLFWRLEPGLALNGSSEAELQKAFALYNAFDRDTGTHDIQTTITSLRDHPVSNGKVATVGFCLGGHMAYRAALHTDADANAGYYGVGIEDLINEADKITNPLVLHIARRDAFVPVEAQRAIHARLDGHAQVSLYDYADQQHAFTRSDGAHYDAEATRQAHTRTLELFARTLA